MYCSNCGKQIPDGTSVCPYCSPEQVNSPTPVFQQQPQPEKKKYGFKASGKGSKSYAAIFTALLVFPASLCVAIDLSFHKYDYWFGYVVGALIVTWIVAVYPFLKITPPAVTALVCFGSMVCYLFYIVGKIGAVDWLTKGLLPMLILTAAFLAIDVALIGGHKVQGLRILSLISLETVLYLIALELTFDSIGWGEEGLRWSLIVSCGLISVIAVLEAFNYIGKINKK